MISILPDDLEWLQNQSEATYVPVSRIIRRLINKERGEIEKQNQLETVTGNVIKGKR
jgi:hypothetical protein